MCGHISDAWYNSVLVTSATARQIVWVAEVGGENSDIAIDNVDFTSVCEGGECCTSPHY